jgi:hypothetical protein
VLINFNSLSTPGPLADPAGNVFFGAQIALDVTEFVN